MTVQGPLEQTPSLKGEYAGFASRFVAFAIDLAIVIAISGVISWVLIALNYFSSAEDFFLIT